MREDLRFSNPSDPQQWEQSVKDARKGRPCGTYDRTGQYISQVVNDARKNKPGVTVMPADSGADIEVAKRLDGIIRHIEYSSRAHIAYDTGVELAARCGLGWLRVYPQIVRPETNHQEVRIAREIDPLAIVIDGTEPDGSDAMNGFAESVLSKQAFKMRYPKASTDSWEGDDTGFWMPDDSVRICEHQYVEEVKRNHIVIGDPNDGSELTLLEDDYHELNQRLGYTVAPLRTFIAAERAVKWCTFNGVETLEETTFPSKWIGFVPVMGYELWVEGKRYVCGLTRRMMDSQRAYNYERSAMVEAVAIQPKAPIMAPADAIEGYEKHWAALNTGNPGHLPYNHKDGEGEPIPAPSRLAPPSFPVAFAQLGQAALADLEASVGMNRAVLGQANGATSGRQERERKEQGDTATYHFVDNLSRSIEHLGRIVVDMIPRLYDTKRQAKILGIDGEQDAIEVNPKGPAVTKDQRGKVVSINPGVGIYDVRVKAGPSYTTQRQEAAEGIVEILQASPEFAPILAPALVKMRDWPDAEKISRMLLSMAPPQVQEIANEGQNGEPEIPPAVRSQMQAMQQQIQEMTAMLDAGEKELERVEQESQMLKLENQSIKGDKSIEAAELDLKAREVAIKEAEAAARMMEAGQPKPEQPDTMGFDADQRERDRLLELERERIKADTTREVEMIRIGATKQQKEGADLKAAIAPLVEMAAAQKEAVEALTQAVLAPKVLVRDKSGKAIGTKTA
jgi:hypothetical protein